MNYSQTSRSKFGIAVFGFLLILGFAVFRPSFALAANSSEGGALFKSKCVMCHGPDGSGNTPIGKAAGIPDLRSAPVQKQSNAQLAMVISKGKGKMPGFDGSLSKPQIDDLIAFIRRLAKKK